MTIHVLIPVFNRLELTKKILNCLNAQVVDESINIIIIDDGSTDGTKDYLAHKQITVLQGDGNLWWGGCIDLAFKHVFNLSGPDDLILLVNNDTKFNNDFIQHLLDACRQNAPAAVGSILRDVLTPHNVLSTGAKIDSWWFLVKDKANLITEKTGGLPRLSEVDALSGRGVLYPVSVLKKVAGMRTLWLPHYLGDYELSLRVKKAGFKLLVDTKAIAYSKDEFGNSIRFSSLKEKLFSVHSPSYLPAMIVFWWQASTLLQRITVPFRLIVFLFFPKLRRARR